MRKIIAFSVLFLVFGLFNSYAQNYGDNLNVGIGIGYTGHYSSQPVIHLNYEFDVAKEFTLAPFITFYSYREYYNGDVVYRESAVPIGVKGAYYFDRLFKAGRNWDFYGAASLGFTLLSRSWDNTFTGDRTRYSDTSPLYLDLHFGTRYHLSKTVGLFLDLSTGISTFGLSFKL